MSNCICKNGCGGELKSTGKYYKREGKIYEEYHCASCDTEQVFIISSDKVDEYRKELNNMYHDMKKMKHDEKSEWEGKIAELKEKYPFAEYDNQFALLELVCDTVNFTVAWDLNNYVSVKDKYEFIKSASDENSLFLDDDGKAILDACQYWLEPEKGLSKDRCDIIVRYIYKNIPKVQKTPKAERQAKEKVKRFKDELKKMYENYHDYIDDNPTYHLAWIVLDTRNFSLKTIEASRQYRATKKRYDVVVNRMKPDNDGETVLGLCKDWLEDQKIPKTHKIAIGISVAALIVAALLTGFFSPRKITSKGDVEGVAVKFDNKAFGAFNKSSVKFCVAEDGKCLSPNSMDDYPTIGENNGYIIYDMSFLLGGEVIQPNGTVKITLDIPEGFNADNVLIYYIDSHGDAHPVDSNVISATNTVEFETDHFSHYVIVDRPRHVTFTDPSGIKFDMQLVDCKKTAEEPAAPSREGYKFSGWYYGDQKWNFTNKVVQDIELVARWEACKYTVVYDKNHSGNVSGMVEGEEWIYDNDYTLAAAPSLEGYTFGGWYRDADCTETVGDAGATLKQANLTTGGTVTLYAKWNPNTYGVKYDGNKPGNADGEITGVLANTETWIYDNDYTLAAAPSLEGYTFGGWYRDAECTREVGCAGLKLDKPNLATGGAVTLYARWIANEYTAVYNGNRPDGESCIIASEKWTYDKDYTLIAAPSLEGYTFDGWYRDAECIEKVGNAGENLTKPNLATDGTVTLYAKWIANKYTVVYNGNKPGNTGNVINNVPSAEEWTYDYSSPKYPLHKAPTLLGYGFGGWYFDGDCTVKAGDAESAISLSSHPHGATITLYAKWDANRHTVTFNALGGESDTETKSICYDSVFGELPEPVKLGHTFLGWFTSPQGGNKITSNSLFITDSDITLYAHYSENIYSATFNTFGGPEIESQEFTYGGIVAKPEDPSRVGYKFAGWYADSEYKKEFDFERAMYESVTVYAKWDANKYVVTFDPLGGECSVKTKDVYYDSAFGELPATIRPGYTFIGWFTTPAGENQITESSMYATDGDITLYAKWEVNTYEIIYNANKPDNASGEVGRLPGESDKWTYDKDVVLAGRPILTGYTFGGWYRDSACTEKVGDAKSELTKPNLVTEGTVTLYAKWTANKYSVEYDGNVPSNATGEITNLTNEKFEWTYDESYALASAPALPGWTFEGWYIDTACTEKVGDGDELLEKPNLVSEGTIALHAKWIANTYEVKYDANKPENASGNVADISEFPIIWTYDENAVLAAEPALVGWQFGGWYRDSACTEKAGDAKSVLTKPNLATEGTVTLYAKWTANKYSVEYDGNVPPNATGEITNLTNEKFEWTYDESYALASAPALPGWTFEGWYIDTACTEKVGDGDELLEKPNLVTEGAIALHAKWIANTYEVKYDANKPENASGNVQGLPEPPVIWTYDKNAALADEPVLVGWQFDGWYRDPDCTVKAGDAGEILVKPNFATEGTVVLYAGWTANTYTIVYNSNGGTGTVADSSHTYDSESVEHLNGNEFSKPNYDFLGWNTNPDGTGTSYSDGQEVKNLVSSDGGSITLYAQWRFFTDVEYDSNDDDIYADTVISYSEHKIFNSISNIGVAKPVTYNDYYKFEGWFTDREDGTQITDGEGELLPDVSGYTNSNKKWISGKTNITLYAHWSQTMTGTYVANADDMMAIKETGTYVIIGDIDMSGKSWSSLDTFSGEIDGQDHCIYNLTYSYNGGDKTFTNYGFCKVLKGTVKNLTFDKLSINIKTSKDGEENMYIGAICGTLNGGTISNVKIQNSTIEGYHFRAVDKPGNSVKVQLGGIAGRVMKGSVVGCTVINSTLSGKSDMGERDGDGHTNVGGITGELVLTGIISNCRVTNCAITSISRGTASNNLLWGDKARLYVRVGGIAGFMCEDTTIESCATGSNTLTATQIRAGSDGLSGESEKYKGAIVGKATSGTMKNCITSETYTWYNGTLTNFINNQKYSYI